MELVAQLPSVAKADEFIDAQTKAWEGCADEVITTRDKVGTSTTQDRVAAVRGRSSHGDRITFRCRAGRLASMSCRWCRISFSR